MLHDSQTIHIRVSKRITETRKTIILNGNLFFSVPAAEIALTEYFKLGIPLSLLWLTQFAYNNI